MEIDISVSEYLDSVKKQYNLDKNMSYNSVMKFLKRELYLRQNLLITLKSKLYIINNLFGNNIIKEKIDNIKMNDLDNFEMVFDLKDAINLEIIKKMLDKNVHYVLYLELYSMFGKLKLLVKLNKKKFESIRECM
jgi:hypothetical protein